MVMNRVEAHYDRNAVREWERLDRHRTEFAVTLRTLAEYLPPPPASILDIGGGPGRYAIHLTRLGYDVVLLDLSQKCIDLAIEKATAEGIYPPTTMRANALQLPFEGIELFDAVLLMGPLYHLLEPDERATAVREALRVLRPAGRLFASFVTRFAPFRDLARKSPTWIVEQPERSNQLLTEGMNPAQEGNAFPDSYFTIPEDVIPFMESFGLRTLCLQGCEGILAGHDEAVNALGGAEWQAWVDLNYRLGREPSLLGASDHLLYVGTKPYLLNETGI